MGAMMPYMMKEQISEHIVPVFAKACKDDIPNVKFCVARVIHACREWIDTNVFSNQLSGPLKEMATDQDKDVCYFAQIALQVA
jgi:hypothetical protein